MYDWDDQFNKTLGFLTQLRNRVSNPGTPLVRASPRTPRYARNTGGATISIGMGPRLHMITEDSRGNDTGERERMESNTH